MDETLAEIKIGKRVTFADSKPKVQLICVWSFAHREARKGHWMQIAVDRQHFARRIERVSHILLPVLERSLTCARRNDE